MERHNVMRDKQMKKTEYFQINSIAKVFDLIEVLSTRSEFDLAELVTILEYPKTTIHRMLLTLQSLGYVQQNASNPRYRASMKFFELGQKVLRRNNLLEVAHPKLVSLSQETGESIYLVVRDGVRVVIIDKMESQHDLKQDSPVGYSYSACNSAGGKSLLAYLPNQERRQLFSNFTFKRKTKNSIRSYAELERDLETVIARGYARDKEEFFEGVSSAGAPIFDHRGLVIAAISITGPTVRINENLEKLITVVVDAAASISRALGYTRDQFRI
jgi:IclR family transcriptional regulator, KDG regulon repressor